MKDKIKTFIREDRKDLDATISGLEDITSFALGLRIVEKYGLSLEFSDETLEWMCRDPDGQFISNNATPLGAIIMWDFDREDKYGKNGPVTLDDDDGS